jgi:polyphenol oxidase
MSGGWFVPDWPVPDRVKSLITTRAGGVSRGSFDSFNLGDHVGDTPEDVAANRAILRRHLPDEPVWLRQVHGADVVQADAVTGAIEADAAQTAKPGTVCAIMTADCLPILICDRAGRQVAAAHAGWRGLSRGVIEGTIAAMQVPPPELLVFLGPAIGPAHYEVGDDVRDVFIEDDELAFTAFLPTPNGKWMANLYELAQLRLRRLGVEGIYGGDYCTFEDAQNFYSYRRDGKTGRMAALIWLDPQVMHRTVSSTHRS